MRATRDFVHLVRTQRVFLFEGKRRFCELSAKTLEDLLLKHVAIVRRRSKVIGILYPQREKVTSISPTELLGFFIALGWDEVI